MLPNEVRPGRWAPGTDNNRSSWNCEALSDPESSETSHEPDMSPKDENTPCNYSFSYNGERTPPPAFENSCFCGVTSASSRAAKSRLADTAKSRTKRYDKLCENTRLRSNSGSSSSSTEEPLRNSESTVARCNCSNAEHCNRDLSMRHRMASSERYTSSNDTLNECKRDDANVRWSRSSTRNILLGNRVWQVLTFIILGFICVCVGEANQCAVGIKTPGSKYKKNVYVCIYMQTLHSTREMCSLLFFGSNCLAVLSFLFDN